MWRQIVSNIFETANNNNNNKRLNLFIPFADGH